MTSFAVDVTTIKLAEHVCAQLRTCCAAQYAQTFSVENRYIDVVHVTCDYPVLTCFVFGRGHISVSHGRKGSRQVSLTFRGTIAEIVEDMRSVPASKDADLWSVARNFAEIAMRLGSQSETLSRFIVFCSR